MNRVAENAVQFPGLQHIQVLFGNADITIIDIPVCSKVRELSHDAAVQYFDMSYILFGLLVGLMALRYVNDVVGSEKLKSPKKER